MTTVHRSALLLYPASDIYTLVSDIESYPEFLPWCRSSRILSRDGDELQARLEMLKGGVHKFFTTRNRAEKNQLIEICLLEGPFRRLEGAWRFQPLRHDACKVSLDMDFEFASSVLRAVIGPVFKQIANSLVDAFCQRAAEIYGRPQFHAGGSGLRTP